MKTLLAGTIFALLLVSPASADETVPEQYAAAARSFYGGKDTMTDFARSYFASIRDGLDGQWARASVMLSEKEPPADVGAYVANLCEKVPVTIAVTSPYGFTVTVHHKAGDQTLTFNNIGNTFTESVDPEAYLKAMGLTEELLDRIKMQPLNGVGGLATVIRPSPDILVIQRNFILPVIYARCP